MSEKRELLRREMPEEVRILLREARQHLNLTATEMYALALRHGTNWRGLAEELVDSAFAVRHAIAKGALGTLLQSAKAILKKPVWRMEHDWNNSTGME